MRRPLVIALAILPAIAAAQPSALVVVSTPPYPVDTSPGTQTDPHVSGDLFAYTFGDPVTQPTDVHIYTAASGHVPVAQGLSPDVSGSRVVFTQRGNSGKAIYVGEYDPISNQAPIRELIDPAGGPHRDRASIGHQTVAWVDEASPIASDIVVFDLVTDHAEHIVLDGIDTQPAVAPNGTAIVWEHCASSGSSCDVFRANRDASGRWMTTKMTGDVGEERRPATDGTIVAYESWRSNGRDIWYQPLGGGPEKQLALAGTQSNASVAQGLIAFESRPDTSGAMADIYIFDTATWYLYRLTDTPDKNERLSDIDVGATGIVTVVYVQTEIAADSNIYALSFTLEAPPACGPGDLDTCESIRATRPVAGVAALTFEREKGSPTPVSALFDSAEGVGLLCVQNGSPSGLVATSAELGLNGDVLFGASDFQKHVLSFGGRVNLLTHNVLWGSIAGEPGTTYTVTVYGPPLCGTDALLETSPLRLRGFQKQDLRVVLGDYLEPGALVPGQGGCASASGGASLLAVLMVVAVLILRPRVQRARARRIERR